MTDMFLLVQGNWLDRICVKFQITEAIVHRSGRNLNKRKICHLQNMCPASCVTESSQNYEVLPHEHWEPVEGARRLWALKRNWYVCAKKAYLYPSSVQAVCLWWLGRVQKIFATWQIFLVCKIKYKTEAVFCHWRHRAAPMIVVVVVYSPMVFDRSICL